MRTTPARGFAAEPRAGTTRRALGALLLGLVSLVAGASASAETFSATPARTIGPYPGQATPAPGGGWQAVDNLSIGASIAGQNGWTVNCNAANYDQDITTAVARSGQQAWRLSNWFHEGCVNTVLSPEFASVQEGVGPSSQIEYSFWFLVPSDNDGLTISSSLSDAPGARLTYAAIRDTAGDGLHVQVVGIRQGSGYVNTLPTPFDTPGVRYDVRSFSGLEHDTWYRLTVQGSLVAGARNDLVTYGIHDAANQPLWSSGAMDSWEDAYLAGPFAAPGTKVTVTRLGWRIVENPDDPSNRAPSGTYALNRPAGVFVDDLVIAPGSGSGLATGFESDRYVATTGVDSGNCANSAAPCASIGYAITQALPYNTIHIASGRYEESVTIPATLDGVYLRGEGPTKPQLALDSGAINQRLITIAGAEDVRIEGLAFAMDQSFVAEGILAMGFVDGLRLAGNDFVATHSLSSQVSDFGRRNAIAVNLVPNTAGLGRVDGSFVTIEGNTVAGLAAPTSLRSGISMDAGVGLIRNNTIAAGTQDITVRFAGARPSTPIKTVRIEGNTLGGRGLQISSPNAGFDAIEIVDNAIVVPAAIPPVVLDDSTMLPADWSLVRLVQNTSNIPTLVEGNTFAGHRGQFRGVTVQNYRNLTLADNLFTPAAGATDFVSLVISNKTLATDPPIVPDAFAITATGNTFDGSGVHFAGRAVEFINDNDANGGASFGLLQFGSVGDENIFSGALRWYYALDGHHCDTRVPPGTPPQCTFLNYNGVGALQNTQVRPFRGDVAAIDNRYGGKTPAAMTAAERNALLARTRDHVSNAELGTVDYDITVTQPTVYVSAAFASASYGDELVFAHDGVSPGTVHFGIDAFATIAAGIARVESGGTVYVADGTYTGTVVVDKPLQLIGNGIDGNTIISGNLDITVSGTPGDPILFKDFIVTNSAGNALLLGGTISHLRFEGVAFDDSASSGVRFNGSGAGNSDIAFVGPGCRFHDNAFGVVTSSAAIASNVSFDQCEFSANDAGIVLFGGNGGASSGRITDWSIAASTFTGNSNDGNAWGGGLWLKTAGAGSSIDGFSVTGSSFGDNGSSVAYNRTGITVRARAGATMTGVSICNNLFTEDSGIPGTQTTGINVYAEPSSLYTPIEICANNVFDNDLGRSVSGLEQFTATATRPVVDITGGSLVNWEHLYFPTAAVVHVDDGFAGALNGSTVTFPAHAAAACVAGSKTYGVDAFASIADALAHVASGGSVCVASGEYVESTLVVTSPVRLLGAQYGVDARNRADTGASIIRPRTANPTISYAGPEAVALVDIESDDVHVDGFVFDGDNPALTSALAINGANPDVDTGIWAVGSQIVLRNNVIRNLVYAGIEGYNADGAQPARVGNIIRHNWIRNIDTPSSWGIGIVLLWNYYATVTDNLLSDVRVGVQTNYFFKTSPAPAEAVISDNTIATSRTGIYHNFHTANHSQASPFTISGNTITGTANAAASGGWVGIFVQSLFEASSVTLVGNNIDASGVAPGRLRSGYIVGQVTSSLASSTAIDGGSVSNVDYGVLVTDGAFYPGAVDDIVVRGVSFADVAIAAIHAEDTALAAGETIDHAVRVTIGAGNSFVDVAQQGALSGPQARIDFAPGVDGLETMLVRAQGNGHRGALNDSSGHLRTVNPGVINDAIADTRADGVVTLAAGEFAQQVLVDRPVTLAGPHAGVAAAGRSGSGEAVIDAPPSPPIGGNPQPTRAIRIGADGVIVDGLTVTGLHGHSGDVGLASGGNYSASGNDAVIRNNRFVALAGTAIYTNGPSNLDGWQVYGNLVDDTVGASFSGINLWKATNAAIHDNTVRDTGFAGIQLGTGSDIAVYDNDIADTGANGINIGPDLTGGIDVHDNRISGANTALAANEGAIVFYGASSGVDVYCNTIDTSGGANGFVAQDDGSLGALGSAIHVFHNVLSGDTGIVNANSAAFVIGSNYYGGGVPSTHAAGSGGILVADALAASPIGVPGCGDNSAETIAVHAGSSPQSTPINSAFADLQSRVTDVLGGAVPGVAVTLDAPASGATALLGAASGDTDYNGIHRSSATANAIAGGYVVTADSSVGSVDFALTNGKAVGTIELVQSSFPYTGGDHVLAARIAQEPGTSCTIVAPATVRNVGPHAVDVSACSGVNYDAAAATLTATVTGEGSVRRLRDDALFDSVAIALADSETEDTDTLQVAPGVHAAPIVVTRPITLIGGSDPPIVNKAGVTPPGPVTVIDGGGAAQHGLVVNSGVENVTLAGFEVRNVVENCIDAGTGTDGLTVQESLLHHCGVHGVFVNGLIDIRDVTIDSNEVHTYGGRGIVVWNGTKYDVTISNNHVHNAAGPGTCCSGIELQDGAAAGAWIIDNVVEDTVDSGIGVIQLTAGSPSGRANIIRGNTIRNTGRFGIEIKIPNGSGLDADANDLGDGAIVVEGNSVDGGGVRTLRDRAGIAVIRRAYIGAPAYPMQIDRTVGVIVRDNSVSGFATNLAGHEGYGIVIEGLGSSVDGNTLSGNDVGLQIQQANPNNPPPGEGDQNTPNSLWFGRGNAPLTCVGVGANTIDGSNGIASRSVPASANLVGGVRNETTGTWYCGIQAAINAASAGHTIRVHPGTYAENVNLDKDLTLVGPHAGVHGNDTARGSGEATIHPASGHTLRLGASGATIDGFTLRGSGAGHGIERTGGSNLAIVNNRITTIAGGSGFSSEDGANCTVDGVLIGRNAFTAITGAGALAGRGVRLGNGHCNVQIVDNDFAGIQSFAVQANGGASDTLQNITIADNRFSAVSSNTIVATATNGAVIERNTFTGVTQGIYFSNRTYNLTATCNTITASGSGVSASDQFGGSPPPNSNIRIFDNAISGGTVDLNSTLAQGLVIGSNWYGGAAPAISSGSVALRVADALPDDPVAGPASYIANCGNNIPVDLVLHDGSPQAPAPLNQPFGQPLQARVIDQLGGAVLGQTVTFAAPGAGASAALTPASGVSDYNGVVPTSAIANGFAGGYDVRATWGSEHVDFALINEALAAVVLDLNGPVGGVEVGETVAYTGLIVNEDADVDENVRLSIDIAAVSLDAVPAPLALSEADVRLCVVNPALPSQCVPLDVDVVGNTLHADFPGDLPGAPLGTSFAITAPYRYLHNLRVIYGRPGVYTAAARVVGVGASNTVYASDVISTEVIAQHAGVTLDITGPVAGVEKDVPVAFTARLRNSEATVADNVLVDFVVTRPGTIVDGDITVEYYDVLNSRFVEIDLNDGGGQLAALFGPPGGFTLVQGYDVMTQLRVTFHVVPPAPGTFSVAATVIDAVSPPGSDGVSVYAADNHVGEVIEPDPDVSLTLSGAFDIADGETLVAAHVDEAIVVRGELVNSGGDVPDLVQAAFTIASETALDAGDVAASYWFVPSAQACVYADAAPGDLETLSFAVDGAALRAATMPQSLAEDTQLTVCIRFEFARAGVHDIGGVIEDAPGGSDEDDRASYAADHLALTVADANGTVTLTGLGTVVFDGNAHAVTATTTPIGLDVTLTYTHIEGGGTSGIAPIDVGTYTVIATIDPGQGYAGSASGTLRIDPATAAVLFAPTSVTYNGASQTTLASATFAGEPDASCVLTWAAGAAPIDAGSHVVSASCSAANYVANGSITFVVLPASGASIALDAPLTRSYDGTPQPVTATVTYPFAGAGHAITYAGIGGTHYPLTTVAPSAIGSYAVVATTTDPNHVVASTSGTLEIVGDVSLTLGGDAVGTTVQAGGPVYSYTDATVTFTGDGPDADVFGYLSVSRSGGIAVGDLAIDYRATSNELGDCEPAGSHWWCALPLIDGGDTLDSVFGHPVDGFPLQEATSHFRTRYARGGHYVVSVSLRDVVSDVQFAADSATSDVAELVLVGNGSTAGTVAAPVDTAMQLRNVGSATLADGAPAPTDEHVVGEFVIAGAGPLALADVGVRYLNEASGQYDAIVLSENAGTLRGRFGPPGGFPVLAGYDDTTLFRSNFLRLGSHTVTTRIVGIDTGRIYATTVQTVAIDTGSAASIAVVGGGGSATVGGHAYDGGALAVLVRDAGGNPVDGAAVAFVAQPGIGGASAGSLPAAATTVAGATSTSALSNEIAGSYTVTASISNGASVSFALANTADADPAQIVLDTVAGTPQTAPANTPFGIPLTVRVADRFGNPLAGQSVAFAAPASSGASAVLSSPTSVSAANGLASAIASANEHLGSYVIGASAGSGPAGSASFALRNTLATAAHIEATPLHDAQATILTAYTTELEACVFDDGDQPVEGVSVTFFAPNSGPSVVFADDTNGHGAVVTLTGDGGCASSGAFSANAVAGVVDSVTAVVSGAGGPLSASYALENLTGAPHALQIVGGDGQLAVVGAAFADALAVRLVDAGGNPIANAAVDFVATPATNGASAGGLATPASTDANGFASTPATANAVAGAYVVTASSAGVDPVDFALGNSIGAIAISNIRWSGNDLTAIAYDTLAQTAAFDTDATLDPSDCSVAYNGAASAPIDAGAYLVQITCETDGLSGAASAVLTVVPATLDVTLGDLLQTYDGAGKVASVVTAPVGVSGVSLAYSVAAVAVVSPVDAGSYDIAASLDNPNYLLGTVAPAAAQLVIDPADVTLGFTAIGPFVYNGHPQSPAITSDGVAVAVEYVGTTAAGAVYGPSATAPTDAGTYSVTVTVASANHGGDPATQAFVIGKATAQVTLSDLIHVFDDTAKSATATTVPAGLAVAIAYDPAAPQAVGRYDVVATVDDANYRGSTTGVLTILSAAIAEFVVDGPTAFAGVAGAPLDGDLPAVRVLDSNGDGVEGIGVLFETGSDSGSTIGAVATTDADGRATLAGWTLHGDAGDDTLTARVPGQAGLVPIVFTASGDEVVDLSVATTNLVSGAHRGDALTYTITIDNAGPSHAASLDVLHALPAGLDAGTAAWLCAGTGAALCSSETGNGNIVVGAYLPSGERIVITLTATIALDAVFGDLIHDVSVTLTSGGIDTDAGNDSASHSLRVGPAQDALFRDGFEPADAPAPAATAPGDAKSADALVWTPDWRAVGQTTATLLDVRGHGRSLATLDGLVVGNRSFARLRHRGADGRDGVGAWQAVDPATALRFDWAPGGDGAQLRIGAGKTTLDAALPAGQPLPARVRVLRATGNLP